MGLKVGDNFTVPLCRLHHTELHSFKQGELNYWLVQGIDAEHHASRLWESSPANPNTTSDLRDGG
jgi:hypothetical protein